MHDIDLLPLLHNRMNRKNQSTPEYIGEFDDVESLPKGDYSAIYFWIDKKNNSSVRLSFNTPKLERWCIEEATENGLDIEFCDSSVKKALVTLEQVVTPAFSVMFDELQKTKGNTQVEACSAPQPKTKKWWQFW